MGKVQNIQHASEIVKAANGMPMASYTAIYRQTEATARKRDTVEIILETHHTVRSLLEIPSYGTLVNAVEF